MKRKDSFLEGYFGTKVNFEMMTLSRHTGDSIAVALKETTGQDAAPEIVSLVSGGSINKCYKLKYGKAHYFLKLNQLEQHPEMFIKEAAGLSMLKQTGAIKVPGVVCVGNGKAEQFLVLEWIERGNNGRASQQRLGRELAELHRFTDPLFGLDYANYMGSLVQNNEQFADWETFFITQRLQPQVLLGRESGLIDSFMVDSFNRLFEKLKALYPEEKPALVHGDLWGGNYIINSIGDPVLIDPAVSFSHREVDLAMSTLFGGFEEEFYSSYNESYPLIPGWQQRLELWNLYPLLIHANLFGRSYLSQIKETLRRFV